MLITFRIYAVSIRFYQLCRKLVLPAELKSQLVRASSSVSLTLAEGYGRIYAREKIRFYRISLGSLRECQAVFALGEVTDPEVLDLADYLGASLYKLANKPLSR